MKEKKEGEHGVEFLVDELYLVKVIKMELRNCRQFGSWN